MNCWERNIIWIKLNWKSLHSQQQRSRTSSRRMELKGFVNLTIHNKCKEMRPLKLLPSKWLSSSFFITPTSWVENENWIGLKHGFQGKLNDGKSGSRRARTWIELSERHKLLQFAPSHCITCTSPPPPRPPKWCTHDCLCVCPWQTWTGGKM